MSFSEQNRNFFVYEQQRERTGCLLTGEGRSDYIHDMIGACVIEHIWN
jgi:hypothetical protein